MFPPEMKEGRGFAPRPERAAGRSGRPAVVVVAVALIVAFWGCTAGVMAWTLSRTGEGAGGPAASLLFWTVILGLGLWRVWRGGPKATSIVARLSLGAGVMMLIGVVAFGVVFAVGPAGLPASYLWRVVPGLLAGASLFTGG